MTILVDRQILSAIKANQINISPFDASQLQPASYDMLLAKQVARIRQSTLLLDPRDPTEYTYVVEHEEDFLIHPGEFVLGSSVEIFTFDAGHVGQVSGKSSLARLGLQVESAGYFDPGWNGTATLELVNLTQRPIRLYSGMKIAQMVFYRASQPAERPYGSPGLGSKYQGQHGPTPGRMHEE